MIRLLEDIATDAEEPIGPDNPLRQVIVNTHSPAVVGQVPDDSLLVTELRETLQDGQPFRRVCFRCLPDTWRAKDGDRVVSKGQLLAYLNPIIGDQDSGYYQSKTRRVRDHPDLQQLLLPLAERAE
jgi:hypothetical protein